MNLIDTMLTRQTTWQIILEMYYVTADLTLVWQYVRYTHWRQCRKESQQAYKVISGDDNCSVDDPAGQYQAIICCFVCRADSGSKRQANPRSVEIS